jgi:seryl-tRNA synthetase
MIDINRLRTDPELFRRGLIARGQDPGYVDRLLGLDARRRELLSQIEPLRAQRRALSARGGADPEARLQARHLGERIAALEQELQALEQELQQVALTIPNLPHSTVPDGRDGGGNIVVRTWGEPRRFSFPPRPHWEIGEQLGILDFARGARLARARFPLYRGAGAMLEWALVQFMLDLHVHQHGYTPILPPFLVNRATMTASGNLPKFADQLFHCPEDDLFLVPTAEVDLVNLYMDEILAEDQLPLRLTAYTPCFRREAGASGRDTRGLIRVHQFNKVELVKLTTPETSYDELEGMVKDAAHVLELLGLPYQVVLLCSGDMGFAAAKTYDLEVWLPGQGEYREISSCSNCEDFQARRGNVRYRPAGGGKPRFVHGLNGSGVAVGRTVVALLENYQEEDGSVIVPEVLRPYLRCDRITRA